MVTMNRRTFLQATAGLTVAGVVATGPGGLETVAGAVAGRTKEGLMTMQAPSPPRSAARYFRDTSINFEFLMMLGGAYSRIADVGTCLAIADEIGYDGDAAAAVRAMTAAADRQAAVGDQALAAGRRASALEAYMQAANYTFAATMFVDETGASDRFAPLWLRQQALFEQASALLDPPAELVRIPYEGTTLPGYFYAVDASGKRRPLLIFNNGSDGALPEAWNQGIAPALERGYNCLTFYGPGQGAALVQQQLFFRPDWEQVVTPVVDYALTRRETDPARIALMGVSQAGYWVPRAVAFEDRVAAAIADPGVMDVSSSWAAFLPPESKALLDAGDKAAFDEDIREGFEEEPDLAGMMAFRMRPYGFASPYDTFKAAQEYRLAGVVDRIRCPMFIADPEGEQFWPGQSQQLYDALRSPKVLVPFTAAEGADLHCEPKNPGLRAQRMFDWLDATLPGA
jgi:hypothetical protein